MLSDSAKSAPLKWALFHDVTRLKLATLSTCQDKVEWSGIWSQKSIDWQDFSSFEKNFLNLEDRWDHLSFPKHFIFHFNIEDLCKNGAFERLNDEELEGSAQLIEKVLKLSKRTLSELMRPELDDEKRNAAFHRASIHFVWQGLEYTLLKNILSEVINSLNSEFNVIPVSFRSHILKGKLTDEAFMQSILNSIKG